MSESPSLPTLLSALALGARSVSSLPLRNDDPDADENLDDEYAFRMSLPEFASLNYEAQSLLKSLLLEALDGEVETSDDGLEDPLLWEKCANACEALLDSVSEYLSGERGENVINVMDGVATMARERAAGKYGQMLRGVVDMEKPQNIYQGFVTFPPQNSRDESFIPIIAFHSQKQMLLDSGHFNRDGHGLDTRYQTTGPSSEEAEGTDRPSYHIEHPFREEIEGLEYKPWQFDVGRVEATDAVKSKDVKDEGVWIGTEDELTQLARRIVDENVREIAIDLEAHSHRTFAGFVCLIQLSLRRSGDANMKCTEKHNISNAYDFLIDALSLRHAISTSLGPILANPNIVKVMHGADSDVPWLQRDFGCYVVNLFDTGRASRALKLPSAGLAYLLRKYAQVEADKSHQLADWRRRPLPNDMREYAVSDTRYLLDIYDQLRLALENHSSGDISIKTVLDRSKDVCLIRYDKGIFCPMGYKYIMDGGKRGAAKKGLATYLRGKHEVTSDLSPEQESALKKLFDWRDRTARQEDESVQYVCPNAALLRIASNRPTTVSALQRLVNPPPPLVLRRSQEILEIINSVTVKSSCNDLAKSKSSPDSSLEMKRSSSITLTAPSPSPRNREMLSPILGTDMLYEKAGWKSPAPAGNLSSDSEDKSNHRYLDVDSANKGYESSQFSAHNLQMSPQMLDLQFEEKEEDLIKGEKSAQLVRESLCHSEKSKIVNGFDVMQYIRPYTFREKEDKSLHDEDNTPSTNIYENITDDDNMVIPKSMSEIYNLSNMNRRRLGKDKSQNSEPNNNNDMHTEKFPEDDIEEAEKILASYGGSGGYFGDNKRQKPNNIPPGKEGDVQLMIKMGWIKNKEEAQALVPTNNPNAAHSTTEQMKPADNAKQSKENGRRDSSGNDYYSKMGVGVAAFDPNAPASSNPFFQGAASSVGTLFTREKPKTQKFGKKNKKR